MRRLSMFWLLTTTALAQTSPVPPNTLDWGYGRIDASVVYQYIGQTVTACGRATQADYTSPDLIMGVSPYETIITFPQGTGTEVGERFSGQLICVTGEAERPSGLGGYSGLGVSAAIYPQHVEVTQMPQAPYHGPCVLPNGQVTGRAPYGGPGRSGPLPPCPE